MNALLENARNVVFDVGQVLLRFEPDEFIFAEHLRTIGHGVKVVR